VSPSIQINGHSQESKTHVQKFHLILLSAPMGSEMHRAYISSIRVLIVLQAFIDHDVMEYSLYRRDVRSLDVSQCPGVYM
jgi:hypothetical protein